MKMTLEKVEAKLLPLGFVKIPNEPEDGIEILGTYGFNYCSHCKRGDCIISIFRQEEDTSLDCLEYQIITENMIMLGGGQGGSFQGQAPRNTFSANQPAGEEQPFAGAEPIIDIDSPTGGNNPDEEEIRVENIPF